MTVQTIDTDYLDQPGVAAAYLVVEGDEAAFVETNTAHAFPRLLEALDAAGRAPEDVRWIIVTHAHLDHAGGAWKAVQACPNATLLAHPAAARHLIDPSKLVKSAEGVYGVERFRALYGSLEPIPAERVRVMDDGGVLRWGSRDLTFLHTRGHANHHMVIHDSATNTVFTGDAFGLCYPALQAGGPWVFPSTSPTDFDGRAAIEAVERIVATGATTAWLTHFGGIGDLRAAADSLNAQLRASVALVEAADASGIDGDALDTHILEAVQAWFDGAIADRGLGADARALVAMDVELNAQGLAFAVRKARFKRSRP